MFLFRNHIAKTVIIVLIAIVFLLTITNPSPPTFKNFLGVTSNKGLRREKNFFLFSIYSANSYRYNVLLDSSRYVAICGNFFEIYKVADDESMNKVYPISNTVHTSAQTKLEQFYNYLKSAGADVPADYETFSRTLHDPKKALTFYNYAKANRYDVPDSFDTFEDVLGLK